MKTKAFEIVNYVASVAVAVVFALFLSGRVGWFIAVAFVCAPVISLIITRLCVSKIRIECENEFRAVCKGEVCSFTVRIANDSFLPSPPIVIDAFDSPRAACGIKGCTVSVMPYSEESVTFDYTAEICGLANMGIDKITISDFLGLFSFKPKNTDMSALSACVPVIPDIAEVRADNDVLRSALTAAMLADDSEDTTEAALNTFGGFPGFDSREYVPGDPLKRVNWKQSAKIGKLFVRLDEETSCSAIAVVLDSTFVSDKIFPPAFLGGEMFSGHTADDVVPMLAQSAVEVSLGMAKTLMESGCSVNFVMMTGEGWVSYPVSVDNDLSAIRTELASYGFESAYGKARLPHDELARLSCSVAVVCTPYLDKELSCVVGTGKSEGKGGLDIVISAAAVAHDVTAVKKEAANE